MDDNDDLERWLKQELSSLRNAPSGFSGRLHARLLEGANSPTATTRQKRSAFPVLGRSCDGRCHCFRRPLL